MSPPLKKGGKTTRLAKRREILIFPRTVGNTGNSREILVIPGNFWEIGSSPIRKFQIYFIIGIIIYVRQKKRK